MVRALLDRQQGLSIGVGWRRTGVAYKQLSKRMRSCWQTACPLCLPLASTYLWRTLLPTMLELAFYNQTQISASDAAFCAYASRHVLEGIRNRLRR